MDCKTESAVRTFLRIEVIILQGLMYGEFVFFQGIGLIPFMPFMVAVERWRLTRGSKQWPLRVIYLPIWFLLGILFGVVNPFRLLFKMFAALKEVARVEWTNRWMAGQPKKPNGHPLPVRTPEEQEKIEAAITMGVVEDYNEEAIAYGQVIYPEEED